MEYPDEVVLLIGDPSKLGVFLDQLNDSVVRSIYGIGMTSGNCSGVYKGRARSVLLYGLETAIDKRTYVKTLGV